MQSILIDRLNSAFGALFGNRSVTVVFPSSLCRHVTAEVCLSRDLVLVHRRSPAYMYTCICFQYESTRVFITPENSAMRRRRTNTTFLKLLRKRIFVVLEVRRVSDNKCWLFYPFCLLLWTISGDMRGIC